MTPLARTLAGLAGGWFASSLLGLVSRLQTGHGNTARKLQSRRKFTRNAALGASAIVAGELAIGTVTLLWPNKTGAFGGDVTVGASSVPEVNGEPFRFAEGKFFIVHTEDGVEALYWKCVHLGCTVPWVSGQRRFVCPCHGSVYTYDGARESGPASRALDLFPATVNADGSLTVNTNPTTAVKRAAYDPSQAVPYP
jgi:cytochrome b6-f complex iron-sulfur subunit